MSVRAIVTVGVAALVSAMPAVAQQRGTMEFGAFGSVASFDNDLTLKSAYGGGGRVGMYLSPTWSIEFEDAEMRAKRTQGLKDVNVGILSGRLVASPRLSNAVAFLIGAGAGVSTETNFLHSYGVDALVGLKIALGNSAAFRVDGVWDWLANEEGIPPKAWRTYMSARLGLSLYRNPFREVRTVTVTTPAPPAQIIQLQDTMSARLLREREAELQALRDSLRNARASSEQIIPIGKEIDATMETRIQFASGSSQLSGAARTLLDDRIALFRADPAMFIVVQGYNMDLGVQRAQAVRDYIVARGISANRVTVDSMGEGVAPEANRRVFRILIVR